MAHLRDFAIQFERIRAQLFSEMGYEVQREVTVTRKFSC